jgi:hypothetical protein
MSAIELAKDPNIAFDGVPISVLTPPILAELIADSNRHTTNLLCFSSFFINEITAIANGSMSIAVAVLLMHAPKNLVTTIKLQQYILDLFQTILIFYMQTVCASI